LVAKIEIDTMASTNGTIERHELDEFAEGERIADQIISNINDKYRLQQAGREKPRGMARVIEALRWAVAPFRGGLAAPAGSVASAAWVVSRIAGHSGAGYA